MASGSAVASTSFSALPEPALRAIMLALPVDARARAACVCRSWRAFLADPSLWLVLDLSRAGGFAWPRVTENLARGAVARAAGLLRVLTWTAVSTFTLNELLVAVIVSGGAELQHLNTDWLGLEQLEAVLAAAPRLQVLNAGVRGTCTQLLPLLRNDPPYGPLRINQLNVRRGGQAADVLAFAAAVASHESVTGLSLTHVDLARRVNALVDAAAERRVAQLSILHCDLDAESVPALARLLRRGSLTKLEVICQGFPHAQEESVPVLSAALRSCRTLTHLSLFLRPPDDATHHTITELLDAAASLPALSELTLTNSRAQDTTACGHALGVLLAANLPSLRTLRVGDCRLSDEGVAALLDGLAANTHLRELDCRLNGVSEAFQRDRLEPVLAALAARAELDA